ncbi:hypothetical protein SAMN02745857_02253 [Andreprevotia lacus DSM 23236]|uniref:Uncharacterized protein n=1 Tax=Andreprevotia lacus DSM 23236 TaxID=1121001 RepID=A0A1W1XP24_9NEIS|nr:hypothetical protein [Andreprevotia lacus]SMC25723.1 hypothetical protein SAMN02745857_02253 [Andreprevotia lacus DSM 23236]
MKKFVAFGALFFGMMLNASATETRYYQVYSSETLGGQAYCSAVWPGSTYFGVRQGMGAYFYIACQK